MAKGMMCPDCGKPMKAGAAACPGCGMKVKGAPKTMVKKASPGKMAANMVGKAGKKAKPKTKDGYGAFSGDRD